MSLDMHEMIYSLLLVIILGTFIVTFPIMKRLGRIMEEWLTLRRESAPQRDALGRIETAVEAIGQRLQAVEQRSELVVERQEFMESLMDQQRRTLIPPGE